MADKRWLCEPGKFGENPKIDDFLAEIEQVCKKHGFLISHEDGGGAFEIVDHTEKNHANCMAWLKDAHDRTKQPANKE